MKAGSVLFFHGHLLHRSLGNLPGSGSLRRVLTNHYMSCESTLPWQGVEDNRDVLITTGSEDPHSFKGFVDRNRPFIRAWTAEEASRLARDQKAARAAAKAARARRQRTRAASTAAQRARAATAAARSSLSRL